MPNFIFITCQIGAERAVKGEIARRWPEFHFAFSQPGFLTFKLPDHHGLADDFDLDAVFARAYGFSLGKVTGHSSDELARAVWESCKGLTIQRIHVWEKDQTACHAHACGGHVASSPDLNMPTASVGMAPNAAIEAHGLLSAAFNIKPRPVVCAPGRNHQSRLYMSACSTGRIDPGLHYPLPQSVVGWISSCPIGPVVPSGRHDGVGNAAGGRIAGVAEDGRGPAMVAVAYPAGGARGGDRQRPGGASQALLARGMIVTGIDPAEMAPAVLNHPYFTHIRRRSTQVRRREFRKIRWLTADMNVRPVIRSTRWRQSSPMRRSASAGCC